MDIFIKSTKSEWEGMAYIAIYGDMGKLEGVGIGQFASNFKDAYVILRNKQSNNFSLLSLPLLPPSVKISP